MKAIVIGSGSEGLEMVKILAQEEIPPIILANHDFGKTTCTETPDLSSLIKRDLDLKLTEIEDYSDGREKRRERRKQQRKNK